MKYDGLMKTQLAAIGSLLLVSPVAEAGIIFQTGNQQYTNVNIAADTDANSIVGDIGNSGFSMTFENMIGPDCSTQVEMHGQHGVAFVESFHDAQPSVTHTGFCSLSLVAEPGTGWTAGDFALDELVGDGNVTFTGFDQFGNPTTDTLAIALNGQNQYNFTTINNELVTSIVITAEGGAFLQDIKQVSLDVQAVPEPSTLALFGAGLAALGMALGLRRRRKADA